MTGVELTINHLQPPAFIFLFHRMEECESVTEVGLNVDSKHHKNVKVQGFCNSQMPLIEKISPECHPILAPMVQLTTAPPRSVQS